MLCYIDFNHEIRMYMAKKECFFDYATHYSSVLPRKATVVFLDVPICLIHTYLTSGSCWPREESPQQGASLGHEGCGSMLLSTQSPSQVLGTCPHSNDSWSLQHLCSLEVYRSVPHSQRVLSAPTVSTVPVERVSLPKLL